MGTLLRRLHSRLDYLRFVYRGELSWIVALALFALTLPISSLPAEIVLAGALLGGAAALFGLVRTGVAILREWRRAKLVDLGLEAVREVAPQWESAGSSSAMVRHAAPADLTAFWWDREVNRSLWQHSHRFAIVVGRLGAGRYHLPTRLQDIAGRALRYGKVSGKTRRENRSLPIRFNGRLLRLATEPTVAAIEQGELEFERVSYFDGECSNELWTAGEVAGGKPEDRSVVHHYACDRAGRMLALENARVANIVGISVLAITSDDHAVLVRQSTGNSIAPGAWAASGSGSLEQRDLLTASSAGHGKDDAVSRRFNAATLILDGMLRELREESLLRPDEIDRGSARITAYWRWAQRAMKPEFSGIVRVNVTGAELAARRHRGTERAFSASVAAFPLQTVLDRLASGASPVDGVLSPSTEVTLLAAAAFLEDPVGKAWRGAVAA